MTITTSTLVVLLHRCFELGADLRQRAPPGTTVVSPLVAPGGVVIVSVHGYLAGESGEGLKHIFQDLISDQRNLHVIVNIKRLTHANPTGVSVLIDAFRLAWRCGATHRPQPLRKSMRRLLDDWCVDDQAPDT